MSMPKSLIICAAITALISAVYCQDPCTSKDLNMQFLCRHNLQEVYSSQLNNATARQLYRSQLLDLLLDSSRPSCFAYNFGGLIVHPKSPAIWNDLWYNLTTDPSPAPCNDIVRMLQTTFAKYGGLSMDDLNYMINDLLDSHCACQQGDDQCQTDFPSILFLLWDDPDPVDGQDLDAPWANNDAGALRLISMIQQMYTWSRLCPMMD